MKKTSVALILILILVTSSLSAQTTESAWALGFGFSYPRFASVDVGPKDPNYGGFISIQRNFNENVAIRVLAFYRNMLGKVPSVMFKETPTGNISAVPADWENDEMTSTVIGGVFDVMYYFSISESVAPFVHFGGGINYFDPDFAEDGIYNPGAESLTTGAFDIGVGSEFGLDTDWKLKVDINYNITAGGIDGINRKDGGYNYRSGIFGTSGDSYLAVDIGLLYYFGKEVKPAKALPAGISNDPIDYEKIEGIVKSYMPKEVVKEVVVEKPVDDKNKIVLVGVNFDFNEATLKPKTYPVLFHAVKVLQSNPNINVEIIGHSDNIGSEKNNIKLSKMRAQAVKDYLVSKGVDANRLSIAVKGSAEPMTDNASKKGRAMNRRIEFKIIKK